MASEIVKQQLGGGRRKELYYFRDHQGLEVDFVVPNGTRSLALIEAKASHSVTPPMADSLLRLRTAIGNYAVTSFVVHRGAGPDAALGALRPGVKAATLDDLIAALKTRPD